jgi:uncharacterized membrane protein
MSISDVQSILQWWFTLFLLGAGFLPLSFVIFKPFFDKGYLFAKILALVFTSYLILILGITHVLPFSYAGSIGVFLGASACLFFFLRKKIQFVTLIKQNWLIFVLEELFFLAALLFWSRIHAFAPDIHGLEKYMDFGFINSILRADYFPPKDMWFTPFFINYYYFGHLMTAVLTKLSALPSNITFNLMLSTIFTFCLTFSFSIAANLYTFWQPKEKISELKRIVAGIIAACLVTLGGNLHVLYAFFKAYPNESPVPIWQLPFLPLSFPNAYWYPNATRFIHNTIHEFPMYSWTVADLHGHVLDIPLVLLIIAVLLALFMSKSQPAKSTPKPKSAKKTFSTKIKLLVSGNFAHLLLVGFLLAVMYMTNAFDGPIYLLLTGLVLLYMHWEKKIAYKTIIKSLAVVVAGFVIFVTPFNVFFKPFASGIGMLCSPEFLIKLEKIGPILFEANHCQHSQWWEMLMLYGFFYFFVISFLIFTLRAKKLFHVDQFVLLLIILATFLIILPELIYLKDIYPAHYRANTMFKLVFQAFIMLSLASGYIMVRLIAQIKEQKSKFFNWYTPFFALSLPLFVLVMLYPQQAIKGYYGELQNYKGLDGTAYLKTLHPGDYKAIQWINSTISGQPVILEAQGDSYTDYARISANTGLPTLLGWTVHEWLWRGSYDIPSPRIGEISKLYETTNSTEAKQLLKKYNVTYVIVGGLEREKYPKLQETKFAELGEIVFQQNNTKIYKFNPLE